jgi:hypothetical protein
MPERAEVEPRADARAARVRAVRVVEMRERRGAAWLVGAAGGLTLLLVTSHAIAPHAWLGVSKYWSAGASLVVWCLGLLLARRPAPYVLHGNDLDELRELLGWAAKPSVAVARGALGYSVAVANGTERVCFLEVEREAEARALLARLGVEWPGTGEVTMLLGPERMRRVRQVLAFWGTISGLLYTVVVAGLDEASYKGLFGVSALLTGMLASVLFVVDPLFRRVLRVGTDTLEGRSRIAEHFRAHAWHPVDRGAMAPDVDVRVRLLDRSVETNETTEAWLTRLDALGASGQGYRGDAYGTEELRRIAEDPAAPTGARLGALRLLARRPSGIPEDLRVRVAADLGPRVRVVLDDAAAGEIAEELEALGPAFRARRA